MFPLLFTVIPVFFVFLDLIWWLSFATIGGHPYAIAAMSPHLFDRWSSPAV